MQRNSRRQTLLICLFLFMVVFFMAAFRMGVVRGQSMSPTFADGQVVLVRRIGTLGRRLRRGDVVLVNNEHDVIIKRIFRLPGEEIDHSFPDILGATERRDLTDYYEQKVVTTPEGPQTHYFVPEGYLVVVGDNTSNSEDSRVFGPVSIRDVLGVVVQAPPAPYANTKAGSMPDGIPSDATGRTGETNRDYDPGNRFRGPGNGNGPPRSTAPDPMSPYGR